MRQHLLKVGLLGGMASLLAVNCLAFNALAQAKPTKTECNLVKNGSFEQGADPGGYTTLTAGSTSINAWKVTQLSVDYIGTYFPSADGKRHLDMTGTPGGGAVTQTIQTQPGKAYTLQFSMAGNPHCAPEVKKMTVRAGSATQQFTHGSNLQWKRHTMSFTAGGAQTPITFTSIDSADGRCGALLDNVSVAPADNEQTNPKDVSGNWDTNWGPMTLSASNGKLTGHYTHDKGRIQGTLSADGRTLQGWWSEYPSYKGPKDGGRFLFRLSPDGKSLSGRWGYGDSLEAGDWTGTRVIQESACNTTEPLNGGSPAECRPVFSLNRNVPPPVTYNVLPQ